MGPHLSDVFPTGYCVGMAAQVEEGDSAASGRPGPAAARAQGGEAPRGSRPGPGADPPGAAGSHPPADLDARAGPHPADEAHPVGDSRAPAPRPRRAIQDSFWWWGRLAFGLAAAFLAWQLILVAQDVLGGILNVFLLAVFAAVIALLCAPAVELLTSRVRLPRTLAVLLALVLLVGVVVGIGALISGPVIAEAKALPKELPILQARLDDIQRFLTQHGIQVGTLNLASLANRAFASSPAAVGHFVLQAITVTFSVVVDIVIILVAAFWFLRDHDRLRRLTLDSLPARWQPQVDFGLNAFAVVVGGYFRAQVTMALLIGTLAGIGSWVIGVPFPLVVALAAGVFELIPLVGPFVGAGVAALFALTVGPLLVIEVLVVFVAIHVIESYIVAPSLQGRFVRLHPLVSFLALFAGLEVDGFLGGMIAVPITSLAVVYLRSAIGDIRERRPELFDSRRVAEETVARRQRRRLLLREYRLFTGNPVAGLWRGVRRQPRPAAGAGPEGGEASRPG
jgi:predicted PurR-regulated permease PerM